MSKSITKSLLVGILCPRLIRRATRSGREPSAAQNQAAGADPINERSPLAPLIIPTTTGVTPCAISLFLPYQAAK
jgi:hypothetical protein